MNFEHLVQPIKAVHESMKEQAGKREQAFYQAFIEQQIHELSAAPGGNK
jgi:hypothetical protein